MPGMGTGWPDGLAAMLDGLGSPLREPPGDVREFAVGVRQLHSAFVMVGFTDAQAFVMTLNLLGIRAHSADNT